MFKRIALAVLLTGAVAMQVRAQAIKTFAVTNSGATAYRFDGGTTNNPPLTLFRGQSYIFDLSAVQAHPFFLDSSGLNNNAAVHLGASDGVTEGTTQLRFDVPAATTLTTVFYQCALHNAMSGTITITDPPPVPALGTTAAVALVALVVALGFVALRRKNRAA